MSPKTPEQLFSTFDQLGIPVRTVTHAPAFTVAESAKIDKNIPGAATKNLFFKIKKKHEYYLVVMLAHDQLDLKKLSHQLLGNSRLSFSTPERLFEVLGMEPGHVTPFSVINFSSHHRLQLVLDEDMMAYDTLNFHPLVNHMTTGIARSDLLRFLDHFANEALTYRTSSLPKLSKS